MVSEDVDAALRALCARLCASGAIQEPTGTVKKIISVVDELIARKDPKPVMLKVILEAAWPPEAIDSADRLEAASLAEACEAHVWAEQQGDGAPTAEEWVDRMLAREPERGIFDLDFGDLAEVRRRVVEPVLGAVFKVGELQRVEVRVGHPLGDPPSYENDAPEVWLSLLDCDDDLFIHRLGKATAQLWDAAMVSGELEDALVDMICESRYGWGQVRHAEYDTPPPAARG